MLHILQQTLSAQLDITPYLQRGFGVQSQAAVFLGLQFTQSNDSKHRWKPACIKKDLKKTWQCQWSVREECWLYWLTVNIKIT